MRFSVDHDWKIVDVDADELHFGRLLNERKDIEAVDLSNTNNLLVMVGDADRPSRTFPEIAPAGSAASTVIEVFTLKNHRRDRCDLHRVRPPFYQRRFVIDPIHNVSSVE